MVTRARTAMLLFALGTCAVAAEEPQAKSTLAAQAILVLQNNCAACHNAEKKKGGMYYILDVATLRDQGKILPKQALKSQLFVRVNANEMPPDKPLSDGDKTILRRWIDEGALDPTPPRARTFIPESKTLAAINADLEKCPEHLRIFRRYFTITHLHNAQFSDDQLQTYRDALCRLLNSLSSDRGVTIPRAIDADKTAYAIDFRELGWQEKTWSAITDSYPYAIKSSSETAKAIYTATACAMPYIRADWFVATASRPPLYHEILQLPETDQELEKRIGVNASLDIDQVNVMRAAFNDSGVSEHNRMIERHRSSSGAYWKSYDFKENTGRKNLFQHPLGPGENPNFFEHDGGEIIFALPNGFQAYMLTNAAGGRLDQASVEIVNNRSGASPVIVNGISCMSCHARGLNEKADQLRGQVQANAAAYPESKTILALYPPAEDFKNMVAMDSKAFASALEKAGLPLGKTDPVVTLSARFEINVDLALAAAEVGLPADVFKAKLGDAFKQSPDLARTLGALSTPSGSVTRGAFKDAFGDLVHSLSLGEVITGSVRVPAPAEPPQAGNTPIKRTLPGPISDLAVGGGGKFILLYIPKMRQIAIFDTQKREITNYIKVNSDNALFAAGASKAIVTGENDTLHKINLLTAAEESAVPLPVPGPIVSITMGSNSEGPLLIQAKSKCFMDVKTMKMLPMKLVGDPGHGGRFEMNFQEQWPLRLRASADGSVFGIWQQGLSPSGLETIVVSGNTYRNFYEHESVGEVLPGPDGKFVYTSGGWNIKSHLFTAELKPFQPEIFKDFIFFPACEAAYFLGVPKDAPGNREVKPLPLSIFATGATGPLATLSDVGVLSTPFPFSQDRKNDFTIEKRFHFIPSQKAIVVIPDSNDQVVIYPFDVIANMKKNNMSFLIVASNAPPKATAGTAFEYQLKVESSKPVIQYKLESGPAGMKVTSNGKVTWSVPRDSAGNQEAVIVKISNDAGEETFHTFNLDIH